MRIYAPSNVSHAFIEGHYVTCGPEGVEMPAEVAKGLLKAGWSEHAAPAPAPTVAASKPLAPMPDPAPEPDLEPEPKPKGRKG